MERISVKKPYTVLVAVIMILALGYVSLTSLTTDLLPEVSLPYLMVITPYPGASPERVEASVSTTLESSLGTISGVKNIYSVNAENFSMVQMEFEDGTDMDSVLVRVSSALDQAKAALPDGAGTPSILEISMDMLATMYVAVNHEGYDIYELSDYISKEVVPYIERQEGVANVSTIGLVTRTIQVDLNKDKIRDINDRILTETDKALADAKKQLDDAKKQVDDGQKLLREQEAAFGKTLSGAIFSRIDTGVLQAAKELKNRLSSLGGTLENLQSEIGVQLTPAQTNVQNGAKQLSGALGDAQSRLDDINRQIKDTQDQIAQLQEQLEALSDSVEQGLPETLPQPDTGGSGEPGEGEGEGGEGDAGGEPAPQPTPIPIPTVDPELRAQIEEQIRQLQEQLEDLNRQRQELQESVQQLAGELRETDGSYEQVAPVLNNNAELTQLRQDLADLIRDISAELGEISGGSMSDLMQSVTRLAALTARARTLLDRVAALDTAGTLQTQITNAENMLQRLSGAMDSAPAVLDGLEGALAGLTQGQLDAAVAFSTAATQLSSAQQQLAAAQQQYESSRDAALKNANLDAMLTASTISSLVYAQNFSMPAGYIDDRDDNSWLLKVGDEYEGAHEVEDILLVENDVLGTVRLSDIADVTVIDNAGDSYAKLNGEQGVILSIYKSSTSGTNEVSRTCTEAFRELEERDQGTHIVALVDQGIYITLIIKSVLSSMLLGALLAIIVLAFFLRDVKPTLVVAISIPLSVLFALVLMYFSKLSLNMMTLSGLALGIGMLVDNSIVVMENIFRLRQNGLAAPRAAVQGAKQVRGAIVASTLTTVCVFLPMVFTKGTVRELLLPMSLSIGYCLMASLAIALTVVPASASTILRNVRPKEHRIFDRIQDAYGRTLSWCLRFKAVSLAVAVGLLAFSVWMVIRMGIVVLPEMTTTDIQVDIYTDETMTREESYAATDAVMDRILQIEGVENVGIMDAGSSVGLVSSFTSSGGYGSYLCYVTAGEDLDETDINRLCEEIRAAGEGTGARVYASAGGMSDMTTFVSGSGLTVNIYGSEIEKLEEISKDTMGLISQVEGFGTPSDGTEEGEPTLHLVIDRDKAMSYGLTTAQIYGQIAARMQTSVTSVTVTIDGIEMDIVIHDGTQPLTRENLLEMEFSADSGMSSMMSGGSSMSSMMSGGSSMSSMMGGSGMSAMMGGGSGMSGMMSGGSGMGGMTGGASGFDLGALSGATGEEDDDADGEEEEEDDGVHTLGEFARLEETESLSTINRKNQTRYLTVTAKSEEGYNTALQTRELQPLVTEYSKTLPAGYRIEIEGQNTQVNKMLTDMTKLLLLALLFVYLVMVAQFQSLLSPFIVLFTIPLAFTGGMFGLLAFRQELSMLSLMGFLVLMGTVVNNGIVFVDYANQLRLGGMKRRDALIATGKTRMRAILMTALTTILAMTQLIFGHDMGSQLGSGMAIVIAGGLLYATLMTLYIVPVMYDMLFRRDPKLVDVGDDLDDELDDAADFIAKMQSEGDHSV